MQKEELFELYKGLYFHEMEVKEKIGNRIQITFAILVTYLTIISYMLRMVDVGSGLFILCLFFLFITFSFCFILPAIKKTKDAFWDNVYKGMPSALAVDDFIEKAEKHERDMCEYNKNYPNLKNQTETYSASTKLREYLHKSFATCSSHNTQVNDFRNYCIYEATRFLIYASIPLFLSSLLFIAYDLDTSSPRKAVLIYDQSLGGKIDELNNLIKKQKIKTLMLIEAQSKEALNVE